MVVTGMMANIAWPSRRCGNRRRSRSTFESILESLLLYVDSYASCSKDRRRRHSTQKSERDVICSLEVYISSSKSIIQETSGEQARE